MLLGLLGFVLSSGGCPHQPQKLTELPVVATKNPQAEADMREARKAEEEGHADEARARYEAFLKEYPNDPLAPVAQLGLGRVLLAQGHVDEARKRFEAVAHHPDPSISERARFYLGVALHLAGQHKKALETLEPYVGKTVDPDDTALLLRTIAAASINIGDRVRAVQAYDQLAASAVPEDAKDEAKQRIATLVKEAATPDDIRTLYNRLPHDGVAWPQVAERAAKQAYASGDTARTKEILAALKTADVPLDDELQELSVRVERAGKANPNVVGAILPLSGSAREVGQQALRGLMLAAGVPHDGPIPAGAAQVIFQDDGGDPDRAAKAVEDLVTLHQAIAIIGPVGADAAAKASKRAQDLGVPLITLTPASGITEAGPLVFRLFFTPDAEAQDLVAAARARGATRFAVFGPSSAFGETFRDAFVRQVTAQGGQVVAQVSYDPGTTSFAKPVRQLRNADFDALFIPDSAATVQLVAPALASVGLWSRPQGAAAPEHGRAITLLIPSVGYSPDVVNDSGRYLQGALFSRPFNSNAASGRDFSERFQARFGTSPDVFAAYAYDAFQLVRSATEHGAQTRSALATALLSEDNQRTVGASGGLGPQREPVRGTRVYELSGTQLVRVK